MLDRWRTRLTAGGVGLTVVALAWVSGLVPATRRGRLCGSRLPVGHDTGPPTTDAFWLATATGSLYAFGRPPYGSPGSPPQPTHRRHDATADQQGYWMVASDGGRLQLRRRPLLRVDRERPPQPARSSGWRPPPDGQGYWLVASDGGVFTFGDAGFFGSTGNIHLNQPIVGHGPDPRRRGLLAGGLGRRHLHLRRRRLLRLHRQLHLNQPIVAMAPTPDGAGYWLVAVGRRGVHLR